MFVKVRTCIIGVGIALEHCFIRMLATQLALLLLSCLPMSHPTLTCVCSRLVQQSATSGKNAKNDDPPAEGEAYYDAGVEEGVYKVDDSCYDPAAENAE